MNFLVIYYFTHFVVLVMIGITLVIFDLNACLVRELLHSPDKRAHAKGRIRVIWVTRFIYVLYVLKN